MPTSKDCAAEVNRQLSPEQRARLDKALDQREKVHAQIEEMATNSLLSLANRASPAPFRWLGSIACLALLAGCPEDPPGRPVPCKPGDKECHADEPKAPETPPVEAPAKKTDEKAESAKTPEPAKADVPVKSS